MAGFILPEVRRQLARNRVKLSMQAFWALAVFVVLGVYGSYPLYSAITQKLAVLKELDEVSQNIEANITELKKAKNIIDSADEVLSPFESYMPSSPEVENYLSDIFLAAASSGFNIKNIRVADAGNSGEVTIWLSMKGRGKAYKLVENVEKLNRISVVKSLRMSEDYGDYELEAEINLYYLPETL